MAVPDYESFMLPLLSLLRDGAPQNVRVLRQQLAEQFSLSEEDLREMLPSGTGPLFHNRVGWATTYLKQARVITSPKRGTYRITERGLEVLAQQPERVDRALLTQFPEFQEFVSGSKGGKTTSNPNIQDKAQQPEYPPSTATPEESLEDAYRKLRIEIEGELLQHVRETDPAFFERLVVDLLVRMGYGGSLRDAGRAVGRSGDGGIDGIIKEDRLGLDVVYVQAKRWQSTVGRPEVQAFAGSLEGERARKGVFITTSTFTREARDYVTRIDKRIILIDGEQLASFMFDFGVGVSSVASYEVKRVDGDYFAET